jgi:L-lactate dehydrogenase complex protein LldF
MSERPSYIAFGEYSQHVPGSIPAAVQQATSRFLNNRQARIAEMPEWEDLREAASEIRLHTLENLDRYLELLERQVSAAGGQVHWAVDASQAVQTVLEIARQHQVKTAVKVKSMATEEIGLNQALLQAGIEVTETDLGEYIIQLDGTGPSHIIVPAVHLKKEQIAGLFEAKLGVEAPPDPQKLTAIARQVLREKFLKAEMGISGANFLVAETGTLVIVTNEGNGRMCTTLPDLHVAVVGIDKVIPDWESLAVLLKLLARSATGQKITTYTAFIQGPRRQEGEYGPK